jgi:acyl carrier protein
MIDKTTVISGVNKVIEEFAKKKSITWENSSDLSGILIDSLTMMRFLVDLEDYFDIYIDEQYLALGQLSNKENLINVIYKIKCDVK